ncbi:lantibiotic dehydratase C-terminal domain-containing protein [Saccharothrix texasensis]|uniref:Lantibiotic biosynthesis dehydratase-like protein n=1 Tax=Saccharothrix texasensis TaxID=103734 RepID=A0A3N1GXN0_9PSEU|nr:lantibiotic dehydratase C-terminal domain-containing protein [Saccharothrix texasensis]ROP34866.1 lantibiotic biosynthesis dehydratase-like protein [Saccharothrix texasensis]
MTDVVCYYHDPVKASLLRDAVLPALAEAEAAGARGHVERHWLHGPHLRVRLDREADLVAERLREHLAAHPSTAGTPHDELLDRSHRYGVAELVPPPYEPIHPDNTVVVEPTDHSGIRELLGSDVLVDLRTRVLRLGVPALRDVVAADDTRSTTRVRAALVAMAAHASRYSGGLEHGYHSFQSHLEDFLLHSDPDGRLRSRFDRVWADNAPGVTETVLAVAEGRLTTPWAAWTVTARELIEVVYDRGDLPSGYSSRHGERALALGEPGAIRRWHPDHREHHSEYHRQLRAVDLEHPLYRRPFTVYRFGTNMLYQLLSVCDVTPVERYLAASLVARAAQRISGVGWSEHIARMAEATR